MEPISQSPITVVGLLSKIPLDAFAASWIPFVARAPAGSQLLAIDDHLATVPDSRANVRVVHHAKSLGIGEAIQTAIWSTETPLIFFVGPATTTKHAANFLERIDKADLVVGCRHVGAIPMLVHVRDLAAKILSRILLGYSPPARLGWPGWAGSHRRVAARRFFGVTLSDPESGVLLARREIFERIPIQSKGEFAWVEILAKANHLGCLLDEVAIDDSVSPPLHFAADARRVFQNPDFGPVEISSNFVEARRTMPRYFDEQNVEAQVQ